MQITNNTNCFASIYDQALKEQSAYIRISCEGKQHAHRGDRSYIKLNHIWAGLQDKLHDLQNHPATLKLIV